MLWSSARLFFSQLAAADRGMWERLLRGLRRLIVKSTISAQVGEAHGLFVRRLACI